MHQLETIASTASPAGGVRPRATAPLANPSIRSVAKPALTTVSENSAARTISGATTVSPKYQMPEKTGLTEHDDRGTEPALAVNSLIRAILSFAAVSALRKGERRRVAGIYEGRKVPLTAVRSIVVAIPAYN